MRTLTLTAIISLSLANLGNAGEPAFNDWTKESLKEQIFGGPTLITYAHGKIKTVAFAPGPHGRFHGPDCFSVILSFLRGPKINYANADDVDYGEDGETTWKDHITGYIITMDHVYDSVGEKLPPVTWHFIVTKNDDAVLTAELIESEKLGPKLVLHFNR